MRLKEHLNVGELGHLRRLHWLVRRPVSSGGPLHRRPERARGEDRARAGAAARRRDDARRPDRAGPAARRARALPIPAAAGDSSGRPVFQVAVGARAQDLDCHAHLEHGLRPGVAAGQQRRHHSRSRHQGPAQYRPDGPDPVSGLGAEPLCLPLWREASDRARDGLLRLHPARAHRQLRGADGDQPAGEPADRCDARERHLDQRPAEEPARSQRPHGPGVPLVGGALRRDARCLAHHRDRPAAGGRVGAGRDQHGAQPRLVGNQPGARRRGPEDRAVEARGRDRDAEGAGRSRAARCGWPNS